MGHTTGDELLVAVAERLSQNVRMSDVVGRIGGDEFVVIAEGLDLDAARQFAEGIRLSLRTPFTVRDAEVMVVSSVGLSVHAAGSDRLPGEGLLRDADTAMYQAKAKGGDVVVVFDASMRERVASGSCSKGSCAWPSSATSWRSTTSRSSD